MKEKESIKAIVKDFFDTIAPQHGSTVAKSSVAIMATLLIVSALTKKTFATIGILMSILSTSWYLMVVGLLNESDRIPARRWLQVEWYVAAITIGVIPSCWLAKAMNGFSGAAVMLGVIGASCIVGLVFVFNASETGKLFWAWADNGANSELKEQHELNPGDVVLCRRKDLYEQGAKDPREIIPKKDRFLHMLILGPTGCGKTSQLILPMACQDIHNLEAGVTVMEPKGDMAREVAMMAKEAGRPYLYFDPAVDNCPFFNPLIGDETEVIENAVTTFLALNPDSPQYFKDLSEQLVRNTLKVLKRLDKDKGIDGYYSTFIWMSRVLQNNGGQGRDLVQKFYNIKSSTPDEAKENADIASWFMNEYFAERSKIYENSSGIRSQVSKVISNRYLRHVLNPNIEAGECNQIDFDEHLEKGGVICISTAQGLLGELGKFLGYFFILQFKSAVFRRPGTEDTRRANFLYIDEFQEYSTPGFSQMLTQGRSYRVACHLATQARSQMAMGAGRDGDNFVNLISTNCRNTIIFPGGSEKDMAVYSRQFGEHEVEERAISHTRKTFNLLTGGLSSLGHPSESERITTRVMPRFSVSDLIHREFGEITYAIMKNNSLQTAQVGLVNWLPMEYDQKLKTMIEDEIVVHEISKIGDSASEQLDVNPSVQPEDFTWEEDVIKTEEVVDFTSHTTNQTDDVGVPFEDEQIMYEGSSPVIKDNEDDRELRYEDPAETNLQMDQFIFDDDHGDPFTDDMI